MSINKKKVYLVTGPNSLLEAAYKEVQAVKSPLSDPDFNQIRENTIGLHVGAGSTWFTTHKGEVDDILTLPQDWNKLMDILEELKKPQVPEYVKGEKHYKVIRETKYGGYDAYGIYGQRLVLACKKGWTPITEEEFIQGGLKELEEAGFVKGVKTQAKPGKKENTYQVKGIRYQTSCDEETSLATQYEIDRVGFCFTISTTGGGGIPAGECNLIPKLPTTSQGILYKVEGSNVYLGDEIQTVRATHVGTLKHWIKLGVQSIALDCGTLTRKDLQTIVGL